MIEAGDDESSARLDVHASAALDRLTRWAAKALLDLRAARAETEREKRWSDRQQAVLELIAARAAVSHARRAA